MKAVPFSVRVHAICLFLLLFFSIASSAQDCHCDFTISLNGAEWFFDGAAKGVKPGDHICFASGDRGALELRNINGAPGNPVILKNMCNGKTKFTAPGNFGNNVVVRNSSFIRFTGGNNPNEEYGLELQGAVMGINFLDRSTDVEADHMYIHDTGCVAIVAKTDPTCDPATWRENFTMQNLYFHHNRISNTGCEGFYIGNSHYVHGVTKTCNGSNITVLEHDMYNVEVAYNTLTNIGMDGIQLSAVLENCIVHDNTVYNFGAGNNYGHQTGIQLGAACHSLVYNNITDTGTGWCFFDGGRGNSQYYNNLCMNASGGWTVTSSPPYITDHNIYANNIVLYPREQGLYLYSVESQHHLLNNIIVVDKSGFEYVKKNSGSVKVTDLNNIKTLDINSLKFVNPAAKDYHLQEGSPAIDAGKDLATDYGLTFNFDFENKPRPETTGGKWDIGPYEYKPKGPTSDAGADINITLPTNTVIINGSGTSETGVLGYAWTKKSGGNATLVNATSAILTVQDLEEGVYVFELEVIDANGSAFDEVTVTVFPLGFNHIPVASAGADQTITLPLNAITLNGSGSDEDGTIVTYEWIQLSGPSPATMANADQASVNLTDLVEGLYEFQLTVTDDQSATASATAKVTVNPQAANQLPTVNAGPNKTIYLPVNQITITATASDPDGTIVTILWEKRTGPAATLQNTDKLTFTATDLVQGSYVFRITVTDDRGGSKFDEVTVQVLQANQSPTANAGADQTITLPTSSIVLHGQGNDPDGSIASYAWTKVSGGAGTLNNGNTADLTVTNMVQGVYVFGLTVTDNNGATGYDEVKVTVNAAPVNNPPVVSAGPDRNITLPTSTLTLNGTATDPDTPLTYAWTQKSGPAATMSTQNTLNLGLSNLVAGSYTFNLKATDSKGASANDDAIVTVLPNTVNQPPVANAGVNKFITLTITNSTTLTGIGADPDGTIASVEWTKVTGPSVTMGGTDTNTLTLNNLVEGEYVFQFTVTDNLGAIGSDQVTVSVGASNVPPTVNAGGDQTITLPTDFITLSATASDPDGTIAQYAWTHLSGPTPTENGANTANLELTGMVGGTYRYEVEVTDNSGAKATDQVTVFVQTSSNKFPIVTVEGDKSVFLPTNTVILTGTAQDVDGTILSTVWTHESGPAVPTMLNETTETLTALNLVEGVHVFRLTAQDDDGDQAYDEVTVTVFSAATNQAPIANGGGNKILQLPTNTITLIGTGTDSDGTITTYKWTKVSGPSTGSLVTPNSSSLKLNGLIEGVYTLMLTVTDNDGAQATALVTVTVIPASVNQNPLANAGQNQTIILPTDNTHLVGSGFDPDGTIQTYAWSKVNGPAAGTITSPSAQLTTLTGLLEGVYTFRLTVTDNNGATGFDDVVVNVTTSAANKIPTASAGGNQSIFLPTTTTNLFGSGSDADGSITAYTWKKINGGTVTMTNSDKPTLTLSNLQEGQYVFQLEVTDNDGAKGTDEVTITVGSETVNLAPLVYVGGNKTMKLPQNSITIVGTASDVDGQITSYSWTQQQGTPANVGPPANTSIVNVSNLAEGTFRFRLTVTDNSSNSAFDEMTLTVLPSTANLPPNVDAGGDASVYLPDTDFTSSANVTDDGTINTYLWTKVSGPAVTVNNPATLNTTLTNLQEGTYVFRLTAVDNNGISANDDITITVFPPGVNQLPVVDAGPDKEVVLPDNFTSLTGTAADTDGTIASQSWSQVSGPNTAGKSGDNTLTLSLSGLIQGTYVFRLTATDDAGTSSSDNVQVIVRPVPPNRAPVVDAGISQVIVLPANSAQVTGTVTDPDVGGTVASILWTQQSGPNTATITDGSSLTATVSNLVQGTYVFRLSATDNLGAVGFDDAIVLVVPQTTERLPPVAYAGEDIILIMPENEVNVVGDGIDPDGFIENYIWEQISGTPASYTFSEKTLSATNLQPGNYTFRLTVIDSDTLSAFDDLNISVIEEKDEIPKFFSPNNDGTGDYWAFRNIESYEQCSLVVFNRVGLKVFTTRSYDNNWDGTFHGRPLRDGDYYYVISCDDGRVLKGAVRIIR